MQTTIQLLIFTVENHRFGLDINAIQRIERAVEITPVPAMPAVITGIIDYHGQILPVFDLRKRLGISAKEVSASWRFLVVQTAARLVIVAADLVEGVVNVPAETITPGPEIEKSLQQPSFLRLEKDIIFLYDIESFLSPEDETGLEQALHNFLQQSVSQ